MRGKKAKALRSIAKKLALRDGNPLESSYNVNPLVKYPVMGYTPTGERTVLMGEKPSGPTTLNPCARKTYKMLKRVV